jgi:hypothetical protein
MERGLHPKFPSLKSRPGKVNHLNFVVLLMVAESAPRQRRSGKKLFDGTPPSVSYKLKKRERLMVKDIR